MIALALSACKGQVVEQGVLVTVDNKSGATDIVGLRAVVTNLDRSETLLLPEVAQSTPIDFPTQFSVSVPSTRSGRVDIAIDGLDSFGVPVARGIGFAILQEYTFAGATIDLGPIAPSCGSGGPCADAGPGLGADAGPDAPAGTSPVGSGGAEGTGGTVGTGGVTGTGRTTGSGGVVGSGGGNGTGDAAGTGGIAGRGSAVGAGGVVGRGGTVGTGGIVETGGIVGTGGTVGMGGAPGTGGATGAAGISGSGGQIAGGSTGTAGACTASKDTGRGASGSGPHKVLAETNSDPGIRCGTIYRPADLGGAQKYPIFVWGEGACSQDGLANVAAMSEIASWGYFIVADGVASGTSSCTGGQDGKALLDYITWAIAENDKPCSRYYQSLDTKRIAADGFSCGGLMAENVSGDPRFSAIGITSSGMFSENQALYQKIHTPFKILLGGSVDMAYENGLRDYDNISALGIPIVLFSKDGAGHGGDLSNGKGDFNTINLAWLNWQLKGDEGTTGKGLLIGPSCKYCNASGWEFKSANIE